MTFRLPLKSVEIERTKGSRQVRNNLLMGDIEVSNKSGTSSQIISLPKGGGALQGIGEKFAPDLHTGTGNFTVPIALPPGRNGFQPQLSLVYSTGNGNGSFGLGWSLSVPGVSRKTSQGIPRYDDTRDTFVLSGAEDLVPVPGGSAGATRYRPRTEGLFARIERRLDAKNDYWEVRSKDGLISHYGTPEMRSHDDAAVADPTDRTKVFAWKLTETQDAFQNRIVYRYLRDSGNNQSYHWDQLYLERIQYVDYTDGSGKEQFLVSVEFEYEDLPDRYDDLIAARRCVYPFSDYRAGFEIRTRKRCKRIRVRTHAGQERLVRSYEFVYLDQRVAAGGLAETVLPRNGLSLLSQIRVVGHDGSASEELPPLEFGYTLFEPEQRRDFFPITGAEVPLPSLGRPEYELADLTGDGLPDMLEMNGAVRYWRNLGGGCFDLPRPMREAPPYHLADPGVQMIDADGDGRIDLFVTQNGQSGYYPLRYDGVWDRRSFRRYQQTPSFNLEDPEVKLVDLDGDGVTDAIRSGSRLECFFNQPENGEWNGTRWVERQALDTFPNVNFSDPRVKWGDMTGDGLQDIVLVSDGNVEYWPSLGRGSWGRRVSMRRSPRYPYGYDPRRILVGDVDGDGLADIVYVDDRRVTLWINQSGNAWSDPIVIEGTPSVSDMDAVRLVDLLGSGINGILWSADANGRARANMFFLDLTGAMKPYLLAEMDNHMGALTKVEYAPSTRFYLKDQKQENTRWKTPLPFPVQVVARVELIDQISRGKLTTEYHYHHGYWDGAEREFRGFGVVEQLDTEVFADYHATGLHGEGAAFEPVVERHFSPPTLTRTWFHQGPVGDEFGEWDELDYRSEFWEGDTPAFGRHESVAAVLRGLERRRDRRDALRALRGSVLRTELYALDGSDRQQRPYTVTESQYGLREEAAQEQGRLRIFFPHLVAQRTTQWERGADPMTQFAFTADYDPYGQPRKQAQVACPRGWRSLQGSRTREYLATYAEIDYAVRDDTTHYMVNRVARVTTWEILPGDSTVAELLTAIFAGSTSRSLIGQTLTYFDGLAFEGLRHGEIGDYGAAVRSESLVLTAEVLEAASKADTGLAMLPPYLSSDTPTWSGEYPTAFQNRVAGLPGRAGYRWYPGDDEHARGFYVVSARQRFDFHDDPAGKGRGLLLATRDPLGADDLAANERDTVITCDAYGLLPTEVRTARDLKTEASYNYRVLQPALVTDPNGNRTAVRFTPLGLPAGTAVMGKVGESVGDTLEDPGMRFVYCFTPYVRFDLGLALLPDLRSGVLPNTLRADLADRGITLPATVSLVEVDADQLWHVSGELVSLLIQRAGERLSVESQPITVRRIRRVHHVHDTIVPLSERDEIIETIEYSDGFGRLLQTRTQVEDVIFGDAAFGGAILPIAQREGHGGDVVGMMNRDRTAPNVVVSGWQVYDNKGRVVEKYEPFFAEGWLYQWEADATKGQHATMVYDPRGRVIRTINPNGSEQRVIYGEPVDLENPERFTPTPWEVYTYDANDNSGRTHETESRSYQHHWNTPSSIVVDGLGRVVRSVARTRGPRPVDSPVEEHHTTSTYDIRGNLLTVTDQLGQVAFEHVYDLANRSLRVKSIDAGVRRNALDAASNLLERRDSKGALVLHAYDELNRPAHLWACNGAGQQLTLRERLIYGDSDGSGLSDATTMNLLGKLYQHHDEAGLLTFTSYDFKGNLLEKRREVIADSAIFAEVNTPGNGSKTYTVDWEKAPLLEGSYETSTTYDALGRVRVLRFPADVHGHRATLTPHYNRGGTLESVQLDGATYVEQIAYNAKGQRVLIAYGNGVMTRYAYDLQTFRLARMRTESYSAPAALTYKPNGKLRQDFAYLYDLAGNILRIIEAVPSCGVVNNPRAVETPDWQQELLDGDALVRNFTYDPLYHLVSATGREAQNIPGPRPWEDLPREGFGWGMPGTPAPEQAKDYTQIYAEEYRYDPAGNMLALAHSGGWTRHFGMGGFTPAQWAAKVEAYRAGTAQDWGDQGNRLTSFGEADQTPNHSYDANGNLLTEFTSRHFAWDYVDRMIGFAVRPASASQASVEACYLYDADGIRVKKWVRGNGAGGGDSTIYIDGIFEHRHWKEVGEPVAQNNYLHVMDDQSRIALVRVGDRHSKDGGPAVQYNLGDHLGSSTIVLGGADAAADTFVNREEYYPYGETSFGSFARKRYRFTGKERDEESGLNYHAARYYAPWLARWVSCDPAGTVDGNNLYAYARSNVLRFSDETGTNVMPENAEEIKAAEGVAQRARDNLALDPLLHLDPAVKQSLNRRMAAEKYGTPVITAFDEPLDPQHIGRKWNMSDSPVVPYNGFLASPYQIRSAELIQQQLQIGRDIALSPLSSLGFMIASDYEAQVRSTRSGAILWTGVLFVGGAYSQRAEIEARLNSVQFATNEQVSETRVQLPTAKFRYLFGQASGRQHNLDRTNQNALQMSRLGVHDTTAGQKLLESHLFRVAQTPSSMCTAFINEYGTFIVTESLFMGSSGQAAKFEATWQVLPDGSLKFSTLIPRGGPK
jgi:RHS repeat-associated protein